MALKALNFKMDEDELLDMKYVASVFNMTLTDFVKEAVSEYMVKLKEDIFYKLTANVQEASKEESDEILSSLDNLSDDDLRIVSTHRFSEQ